MMTSNTRVGKVYEEAMCLSIDYLGKDKAYRALTDAIEFLEKFPKTEAVVICDGDTVINVGEAIEHLKKRREMIVAIAIGMGSRLSA